MKLYHMPGACSLADLIVLNWIGVEHETVVISLQDTKSPEYLALNAGGSVPLLIEGDFSLTENVAILGYLADRHPAFGLLGDGSPHARAEVMRWLAFLNSDVHMAFKPIFTPSRVLDDAALATRLADAARVRVRAYLERLDRQLARQDWLTGHRSVADPYLYVILRWARAKDVALNDLDSLLRFGSRMDGDAGVRSALEEERTAYAFVVSDPG